MACTARIHSMRPLAAVAVGGLSLGLGSVCVRAQGQEASEPVLPEITVVARHPPYYPAREGASLTVLDRDTLARSEERDLNGVFRGLPSVTLQEPVGRGKLSSLFVRGASAGLGQLSFDGVPLYSSVNGSSISRPFRRCAGARRNRAWGARAHPAGLGVEASARLHPQPREPAGLQPAGRLRPAPARLCPLGF